MKTTFPSILTAAVLAGFAFLSQAIAGGSGWMDDLDKAFAKAKEEKKPALVVFTGSDWCPPCKMMHAEVFSKEEFAKKAAEKYLLVEIDIPHAKDKEAITKKNQPILEKYKLTGVPTVILFDKEGKEFDRFIASKYPTVEKFLGYINEAVSKKDMQ